MNPLISLGPVESAAPSLKAGLSALLGCLEVYKVLIKKYPQFRDILRFLVLKGLSDFYDSFAIPIRLLHLHFV